VQKRCQSFPLVEEDALVSFRLGQGKRPGERLCGLLSLIKRSVRQRQEDLDFELTAGSPIVLRFDQPPFE
jgi:hypothetical protein